MRLIMVWIINAAALMAVSYLFANVIKMTGFQVNDYLVALIVALILGLLNALVRPALALLKLPVTPLVMGIVMLVLNALFFMLIGKHIKGFQVGDFKPALIGAVVFTVISWLLSTLLLAKPSR